MRTLFTGYYDNTILCTNLLESMITDEILIKMEKGIVCERWSVTCSHLEVLKVICHLCAHLDKQSRSRWNMIIAFGALMT